MRITRRWLGLGVVAQFLVGYVWTSLLVMSINTLVLATLDRSFLTMPLIALSGLAYSGLTLYAYLAVAQGLLNSTVVTATAAQLAVTHGPVAGGGRHRLRRDQLVQLVCVQVPDWLGRPRWDLLAVTRDGGRVTLIRQRPLDELLRIERAAESALGIVDVPAAPGVFRPQAFFQKSITDPLLPVRLAAESSGDRLVLSWRWFNPSALVILAFLAVWLFANLPEAAHIVRPLLLPSGGDDFQPSLDQAALPLWQVTCALFLGYFVLAFLFNRTFVSAIRGGTLAVRHGPLPLLPGTTVAVDEVRQLFVQIGHIPAIRDEKGPSRVRALLADGRRITLARTPNPETAIEIEHAIEGWLGIENAPEADA